MYKLEQSKKLFLHDRYATEVTGIHIVAVNDHYAQCTLSLDSRHRNAMGGIMGGAIFTLADFAFAIAANTDCLDNGKPLWVSAASTIVYHSNTADNTISASTRCLKHGRSCCSYEISVTDSSDKLIATILTNGSKV